MLAKSSPSIVGNQFIVCSLESIVDIENAVTVNCRLSTVGFLQRHHRFRQGSVKVDWVERDPSPTALRSPLSPRERAAIFDF